MFSELFLFNIRMYLQKKALYDHFVILSIKTFIFQCAVRKSSFILFKEARICVFRGDGGRGGVFDCCSEKA